MEIDQIARRVAEVSIYSEQSVRDFFGECNHHGQAAVGVVVADVLLSQLRGAEKQLATQSRLTISCGREKLALNDAYQLLREATGLDDCGRYLAKASNLARTLALRDGIVLTRTDLWRSTAPADVKYWSVAALAIEQITGIPVARVIGESTKPDNQS